MKNFLRALRSRPLALGSLIVLFMLYGAMIFCEFLAPFRPADSFEEHSYYPPNLTFWSSQYGLWPQIQKYALIDRAKFRYGALKNAYIPLGFFVHGPRYKLWGLFSTDIHLFGVNQPYASDGKTWQSGGQNYPVFIFGADNLGRDLFSRILYGSRISLTIGFIGISISLLIAIVLGGLAGYFGGWIDWIIMRGAEFIILIPGLYLILFLRSILARQLDPGQAFILITVILSFVSWPGRARLIRGLVHSIKREDFIADAQLAGIPSLIIIIKQIIPQMSSILIVGVTLGIPGFILGETVLSYLGLGIIDPAVSWGSLLNKEVTSVTNLSSFPWFLFPGLFLLLTTLAFNFLGDLLRDFLDPYYKDRLKGKA